MEIVLLNPDLIRRYGKRILNVDPSMGRTLISKGFAFLKKEISAPEKNKMISAPIKSKMINLKKKLNSEFPIEIIEEK